MHRETFSVVEVGRESRRVTGNLTASTCIHVSAIRVSIDITAKVTCIAPADNRDRQHGSTN